MSTPHMSGRPDGDRPDPDRERYEPSDLLDADGRVDLSTVKEITTPPEAGGPTNGTILSPEACAEIRDRLASGDEAAEHLAGAEPYGIAPTTLRQHARGDCWHTHDTPPVTWDASDGWHREEVGGD